MNKAEQNYRLLQEIEANRQFLLMAYRQNPKLLESAEARIKQLFEMPAHGADNNLPAVFSSPPSERGTSLIELIMFIVIVSVALAGILLVMNVTTKGSADPLIHKQAIAAAESLLEEIQLQDFPAASGAPATVTVTKDNRTDYHTVTDYDTFSTTGIYALNDGATPITKLENYNASVAVVGEALGSVAAGSAVRITVTVTSPQSEDIKLDGYRTWRIYE